MMNADMFVDGGKGTGVGRSSYFKVFLILRHRMKSYAQMRMFLAKT